MECLSYDNYLKMLSELDELTQKYNKSKKIFNESYKNMLDCLTEYINITDLEFKKNHNIVTNIHIISINRDDKSETYILRYETEDEIVDEFYMSHEEYDDFLLYEESKKYNI